MHACCSRFLLPRFPASHALIKSKVLLIKMSKKIEDSFDGLLDQHPDLLDLFAQKIKNDLDVKTEEYLEEDYKEIDLFQKRLFRTWKSPILRIDAMLVCAIEISTEVNTEYRHGKFQNSAQLNIATRLHARSMHIAKEISHLLKGGYADGAMARWRSLHETATIATFLSQGDENLSMRFLEFQAVVRHKAAKTYVKHQDFLDFEKITSEQITEYEDEVNKLCNKYGKDFKKDYGWAFCKFPDIKKITFFDIEASVNLDYLRIHYGFANKNVHAGIDSIGFKLGLSLTGKDILLAGPSNEGLTEPFQCTSLSICQATDALISLSPNTDRNVKSAILWQMHESMKKEIVEAEKALIESAHAGAK